MTQIFLSLHTPKYSSDFSIFSCKASSTLLSSVGKMQFWKR